MPQGIINVGPLEYSPFSPRKEKFNIVMIGLSTFKAWLFCEDWDISLSRLD